MKLLRSLATVGISLFLISFISIPMAFAALSVRIEPNPPLEGNINNRLVADGCPDGSQVDFHIGYKKGINTGSTDKTEWSDTSNQAIFMDDGANLFNRVFKKGWTYTISTLCHETGEELTDSLVFTVVDEVINPDAITPFPTQPPPPPPLCATDGFVDGKCVKVDTAIGEINTDGPGFIYSVFIIILSLSGGILLLSIIYAGYLIMMSRGEPEKIQKGKELLTSAIVGFLFIVFSYVIFGVITVDILHLPGFSTS